ncbi:MAG: PKD domain-containing protein [Solirubrobacteraceae bacterium]
MLQPRLLLLVPLLALALAAPASAAQFYADDNGALPVTAGCQDSTHPCATIAAALTASRALAGIGDTINLAAGTYSEDVVIDQTVDNGLTIDGVRSGLSTSTISAVNNSTHAVQFGASSAPLSTNLTLKDVVISVAAGSNTSKYAIDYYAVNSKLDNVAVVVSDPANMVSPLALSVPSGTSTLDHVVVVSQGSAAAMTLFSLGGTVTMTNGGIAMSSTASTADGIVLFGKATITDTLVRLPAASAATGVGAVLAGTELTVESSLIEGGANGVLIQQGSAGTVKATIRRSTIDAATAGVDDGGFNGTSVNANTQTAPTAVASIVVTDSLLVDQPGAHAVSGNGTPTVTCTNSNVPLTINPRVACDATGGNQAIDPAELFVDAPTLDYKLKPGSPAIDAGVTGAGEPATDQASKPRAVDGNFDCVAKPDLGALELQGQENTAPVVTAAGPATGATGAALTFTATASDAEDTTPTVAWAFSDGAAAGGTPAQHAFAQAGAQSATVTATDSHGCKATAKADVAVTAPTTPPPPDGDGPSPDAGPVFLSATLKGRKLRFTLSKAAKVQGRIDRRSCMKVAGKRRCRMVTKRRVALTGASGLNRATLKKLPAGRYRLVLTATDAAGHKAKAKRLSFRVRRP